MPRLPFRQIHLDFHTSELITPIAQDFDPAAFADTLTRAHVDSVTCFSRCHHGMIYHDTQFAQARHPGLSRNLLGEQIEACHQRGIRVPIYITLGWDELQARLHPEWLEVTPEGTGAGAPPFQPGWHKLCFNTGYVDYVEAQTREVLELFDCDALFFDIAFQNPCVCAQCLRQMSQENLDPELDAHRRLYAGQVLERLKRRLHALVRSYSLDAGVFFNAGHVGPEVRGTLDAYTHLELESLPSGGWGYDHFPYTVRYARNLGLETLGMTGKFHLSWGDFGGFKNQAALEYECFTALAEGAKCSIGDQLHPRGALDPAAYERIGAVYQSVAAKEPWCRGALPVTEVAVLHPDAAGCGAERLDPAACGALKILLEGRHQADVVDLEQEWDRYKLLVLADHVRLDKALEERLAAYLESGGKLLATYRSGLRRHENVFGLERFPAVYRAEGRHRQDYLVACGPIAGGIPASPHIVYERGLEVDATDAAAPLAEVHWPYFDRAWNHFCSHNQTPVDGPSPFPAAVHDRGIAYFAHPLFSLYYKLGVQVYKQLLLNTIDKLLLPEPLVRAQAPSTARVTLTEQPIERRYVAHVLHYIPERRCQQIDVVEDVIPLYNVELGLRLPAKPARALLAPGETPLDITDRDGRFWVTLPEVRGHAMAVFEC